VDAVVLEHAAEAAFATADVKGGLGGIAQGAG
jgi:hypothetical protein